MSIQDIQNDLHLVECFKEFASAKNNFTDAIGQLDGAIQKLESSVNYTGIASEEEKLLVNNFKEKIILLQRQ